MKKRGIVMLFLSMSLSLFSHTTNVTVPGTIGVSCSDAYPEGPSESILYSWMEGGTNGLYRIKTTHSAKPDTRVFYDAFHRETRFSLMKFDGVESHTDKLYDSYGRLQQVSLPFTGSSASDWDQYGYDGYDRPTTVTEASGRTTSYVYSGNTVKTTRDGIATTQYFDTQGHLTSVSEPVAGTITYNLRPDGQPSSIDLPGSVSVSFGYDHYGRRTSITDPSAGLKEFGYDAAGNLNKITDANGKITNMNYDSYNRLFNKSCPELSTTYVYNSDGLLQSESSSNGTSSSYSYDTYGRLSNQSESYSGKSLQRNFYYLGTGALDYISFYVDGQWVVREYYTYQNGHNTEISHGDARGTATKTWKLNSVNAFGQPTNVTTGSFNRNYGFNAYGISTGRAAGSFLDQSNSFDASKGNLDYRKDHTRNIQENFTYDNLNRLTGFAGKTAVYNEKGNLTSRTDLGTIQYNTSGKPYAISGVTAPTADIPLSSQTVAYTSFMRPASVSDGEYAAAFTYNGRGERVKMELKKNGSKELYRHYLAGCYEMDDRAVGGTKEKLYLGGDFYTAPVVYVKEGSGNWSFHYICRDYLGSITHITNSSGTVVQELSYDAWGRLRNPANQTAYAAGSEPVLFLGRGYTGHEQLTQFGLINMNARLYDPVLGRFLSPDPYVQAPGFSQSFNRYAYAMNNPMCYIDPSGEIVWFVPIIIGAVIGAYSGGSMANKTLNPVKWDWGSGQTWAYMGGGALIGAGGGAAAFFGGGALGGAMCGTMGIGTTGVMGGAVIGGMAGMIGGFVNGVGFTALNGGSFKESMMGGLKGAALGAGFGAVVGGITGGIQSYADGKNIWTGNDIAPGRSAFSFKNTPVKGSALKALGSYDFIPDPSGDNVTLYRGTTGSESNNNTPLFMTDDANYAAQYVANGGKVVEVTIPRSTLDVMYHNGVLTYSTGQYYNSFITAKEYIFSPSIKYLFNLK